MDVNSANQVWSKWVWFVSPKTAKLHGQTARPKFDYVLTNLARFGRKCFGSSSSMRIRETNRGYIIEVLTEGHPVHDKAYVEYIRAAWQKFFENGFGGNTTSKLTAKLMAGSRQDGTPAEQMLILPTLTLNPTF